MSSKEKIALICLLAGTRRQGGTEHALLRLVDEFKKQGHDVDIFCYAPSANQKLVNSRIPVSIRLAPFIRDMFIAPYIGSKLLRRIEGQYSVILSSSTTIAALYKPRTRLVIHGLTSQKFEKMSMIPKYKLLFNPLLFVYMKWVEKRSFANAHKAFVVHALQKSFIIRNFQVPEAKVACIPNGVDTNLFKPARIDKKRQVIFVGRSTAPKGFYVLMQAASRIQGNILVVTQKVDDQADNAIKANSNVNVIVAADKEQLAKLYAESAVFSLPSFDEEQPLTVMEAMATGLPVVVSRIAASDIVEDGVNGRILQDIAADQLADACNGLLSRPTEASNIGRMNRKRIEEKYALNKQADAVMGFIAG